MGICKSRNKSSPQESSKIRPVTNTSHDRGHRVEIDSRKENPPPPQPEQIIKDKKIGENGQKNNPKAGPTENSAKKIRVIDTQHNKAKSAKSDERRSIDIEPTNGHTRNNHEEIGGLKINQNYNVAKYDETHLSGSQTSKNRGDPTKKGTEKTQAHVSTEKTDIQTKKMINVSEHSNSVSSKNHQVNKKPGDNKLPKSQPPELNRQREPEINGNTKKVAQGPRSGED